MKIASRILSTLILIVLIIALVLFTIPKLFGISMYIVTSGSMAPTYKVGDVVYAFPVQDGDGKNIKVGDVITYMISQDTNATHRVVRIEPDEQTQGLTEKQRYLYYTQGDNNPAEDGKPQYFMNVIGVVRFSIPMIGKVIQFVKTTQGLIISITVLLAIILLTVIFNMNEKSSKTNKQRSVRGSGNKKQQKGFDRKFGKKAIKGKDEEPDALSGGGGNDDSAPDTAAGIKRIPPKGWGSGKSRQQ